MTTTEMTTLVEELKGQMLTSQAELVAWKKELTDRDRQRDVAYFETISKLEKAVSGLKRELLTCRIEIAELQDDMAEEYRNLDLKYSEKINALEDDVLKNRTEIIPVHGALAEKERIINLEKSENLSKIADDEKKINSREMTFPDREITTERFQNALDNMASTLGTQVCALDAHVASLQDSVQKNEQKTEKLKTYQDLEDKVKLLNAALLNCKMEIDQLRSKMRNHEMKIQQLDQTKIQQLDQTKIQQLDETEIQQLEQSSKTEAPQRDGNVEKIEAVEEKVDTLRERLDELTKKVAGPPLKTSFEKHQDLIQRNMMPLKRSEYEELSALESIAGLENGSATQIFTKNFGKQAAIQKKVETLKTEGVRTKEEAMAELIKRSGLHSSFGKETVFYCSWESNLFNKWVIVAFNKDFVVFLDENTKEILQSWPMSDLDKCHLNWLGRLEMNFGGRIAKLGALSLTQELLESLHQCMPT